MRSHLIFRFSLPIFVISLMSTASYAQKIIPIDTSKKVTIRVDPANTMGGNVSEIFASVDYIPLETTSESTFGRIEQLEVTDDRFIILDENTNCILIFKKDGKFVAKIKGGDKKYPGGHSFHYSVKISDFKLNRFTREIMFSSFNMDTRITTWHFYDIDGKKSPNDKREHRKWSATFCRCRDPGNLANGTSLY
ncbi:MAG: 6-bladed beta-propeller, partial [Sphingobacteriales bacterium]